MEYVLTILTNGRRTCFERSLHAFMQHVRPLPSAIYVFDDGGQTGGEFVQRTLGEAVERWEPEAAGSHNIGVYDSSPSPLGMCAAHERCWEVAGFGVENGEGRLRYEWAFHLEDDFVILRPVDLTELQHVLCVETRVVQMALVRAPWGREIEFGGYIPQMPGHYTRRLTSTSPEPEHSSERAHGHEWIETTRNWATNPALFRTALAREFPWSPEPGCETEIGPRILAAYPECRFGLWGWGEPWCSHIALERQPGAHGY